MALSTHTICFNNIKIFFLRQINFLFVHILFNENYVDLVQGPCIKRIQTSCNEMIEMPNFLQYCFGEYSIFATMLHAHLHFDGKMSM